MYPLGNYDTPSIKTVGKINLEGYSESAMEKLITRKFNHFSQQLFGRYGITITKEEYIFYSLLPYLQKEKKDKKRMAVTGILRIKEVEVKVVKCLYPPKLLLTALPIKKNKREQKN